MCGSINSTCSTQKASWSRFNQAVSALRFLYGTTLGRPEYLPRLPYGKRPRTLPLVLSQDEILQVLRSTNSPAHRMVLMTMVATGLRVRPAEIDPPLAERMTILVDPGNGEQATTGAPLPETARRAAA